MKCEFCGRDFSRFFNLKRHASKCEEEFNRAANHICCYCANSFDSLTSRNHHEIMCSKFLDDKDFESAMNIICGKCGKVFSRPDNRKRHENICHEVFSSICSHCGYNFTNIHNLLRHEKACGSNLPPQKQARIEPKLDTLLAMQPDLDGINEYETAFQGCLKSYFIRCDINHDLPKFLQAVKQKIIARLRTSLSTHETVKFNILVDCTMINQLDEELNTSFKTKNHPVFRDTDLDDILNSRFDKLNTELSEVQLKKSGWHLLAADGLRLRINKYVPLGGSTYIPLPQEIECRKACINVQNYDNKCFQYAILSKLVGENHPCRASSYANIDHTYDFDCITYPTPLHEIKKFEKINQISINVFGLDENNKVYPLKVVDEELIDHRDILSISNNDGASHYIFIKNFEKLVGSGKTKHEHVVSICKRCFSHFDDQYGETKEVKLEKHLKMCLLNKAVRVDLPHAKPYVKFEHVERGLKVPFVVYCDFECILKPVQSCTPDAAASYTVEAHKHEVMSFCVYLKQTLEYTCLPTHPFTYRGRDAVKVLLNYLKGIGEKVSEIYKRKIPMDTMSPDEIDEFNSAHKCYMCDKHFNVEDVKVRDHCHMSGKYRGAAHNSCNLKYQVPHFLPVIFHNLSGYDSHFIVRELGYDGNQIDVIPNTEEKYISLSKTINRFIKLRFLDSFCFMSSSLDSLARNLPNLEEIRKFFPPEHIPLLTRKGVFPYEYVTSWEKLNETSLPPKSVFYSNLTKTDITDEDYLHATKVWNTFGFTTLGQ
ncbi:uncharacterized protein LOC120355984 [Nilaparvata lugens]|uniref:uncharacterized protein LOC120355984 n=1 Tax=Nilaparvata lugens TaxID=108931 RepID=UPI00193E5677|nr:uncharacterized protein LOC120355984 [Nilaparvata lugens]